jgi:hypothetical protein
MTRFILSIILCIGAASAFGQTAAPRQAEAQPANAAIAAQSATSTDVQPKIVQAALVLPTSGQPMRSAGVPSTAQQAGAAAPANAEDEHPTTMMLLAALALMLGIALRRWSLGDQ